MRLLFLTSLLLGGLLACQPQNPNFNYEDGRNPYFQKAQENIEANNFVEAVKNYEAALQKNADVALAHYELGRLYSDRLHNPLRSIYHFNRYLEQRPASDQHELVLEFIEGQKLAFLAALPNSPFENQEALARLQNENTLLKNQNKKLKEDLEAIKGKVPNIVGENLSTTPSATQKNKVETPQLLDKIASEARQASLEAVPPSNDLPLKEKSSPLALTPQTYIIQKGDSLWKISRKFYPDEIMEGIEKIQKANPETLPEGKLLKIGTEITIP